MANKEVINALKSKLVDEGLLKLMGVKCRDNELELVLKEEADKKEAERRARKRSPEKKPSKFKFKVDVERELTLEDALYTNPRFKWDATRCIYRELMDADILNYGELCGFFDLNRFLWVEFMAYFSNKPYKGKQLYRQPNLFVLRWPKTEAARFSFVSKRYNESLKLRNKGKKSGKTKKAKGRSKRSIKTTF